MSVASEVEHFLAPPTSFEVARTRTLRARVAGGTYVHVRRSVIRLRPGDGQPVLGLEHTVARGHPSRGQVVLIHGLAQNHRTWRTAQRSFVAMLAARGYEVFNLDLRGHGWSRRFGAPAARGVADYVDDLRHVVDALPGSPMLIGHSLGAAVAVLAALEVEVRGVIHVGGLYTFAQHSRLLRGVARATVALHSFIPGDVHVNVRGFGRMLGRRVRWVDRAWRFLPHSGWSGGSMEYAQLVERLDEGFDRSSLAVWKDMSRWAVAGGIDPAGRVSELQTPMLVVVGEGDDLAHPRDGKALFDACGSEDATFIMFCHRDHGYAPGHLDIILGQRAPEVVWPVLADWLDERSPSDAVATAI